MKRLFFTLTTSWVVILILAGCSSNSPVDTVKNYIEATYSWNYDRAYQLISEADRNIQTLEEYIESRSPGDPVLEERVRLLAPYIRYETPEINIGEDKVTLKIAGHLPNWSAIGFGGDVKGKIKNLHRSGNLPTVKAEQTFQLVREKGEWRIFLNWSEAIVLTFGAEVKDDLPWEFGVRRNRVIAGPGEVLKVSYWAKNNSEVEITGKALHIIEPEEFRDYLETIQCFCFFEETLAPGEEKELPLVFRVNWDVPQDVNSYQVRYEFYPIESFPDESYEDWQAGLLAAAEEKFLSGGSVLEVRVTDHREAIEDFTSLEIVISKVSIHPTSAPRLEGWIDLAAPREGIDITKHLQGPGALVLRTTVDADDYNALRLGIDQAIGRLKNGKEVEVEFVKGAVFLPFTITSEDATVVTVDLVVNDLSDHPGKGYEMRIRSALQELIGS